MDTSEPTFKNCPICNGESKELKGDVKTYLEFWDEIVTSKFSYCSHCDYAFMVNPFNEEKMKSFYETYDQLRRADIPPPERKHVSEQAEMLNRVFSKYNVKPERILEIGADNGSFLQKICELTSAEGYFDELNPEAKKILLSKNLKPISELAEDEKFDGIAFRHVFEHIPEPIKFLKSLKPKLNKNGLIFIEVPDYSALSLEKSDHFQMEHVSYFSVTALQEVCKRAGAFIHELSFSRTEGYSTTTNLVLRAVLEFKDTDEIDNTLPHWQRLLDSQSERFKRLDNFLSKSKNVGFYGAGTISKEYFAYKEGQFNASKIYDGNKLKQNTEMFGLTVEDPEVIDNNNFDYLVLMVLGYEAEIREFLKSKNVDSRKVVSFMEL